MRATQPINLIILYFITLIVFGEELVKQGTSYQKYLKRKLLAVTLQDMSSFKSLPP
jgi:hypothetical protein